MLDEFTWNISVEIVKNVVMAVWLCASWQNETMEYYLCRFHYKLRSMRTDVLHLLNSYILCFFWTIFFIKRKYVGFKKRKNVKHRGLVKVECFVYHSFKNRQLCWTKTKRDKLWCETEAYYYTVRLLIWVLFCVVKLDLKIVVIGFEAELWSFSFILFFPKIEKEL